MTIRQARPDRRRIRDSGRLRVEALEPRQVLAHTLAALGSDIGSASTPLVQLVEAESGQVLASTLAFEDAFRGGVRVAMANVDGRPGDEILAASGPGRVGEIRAFTIDNADTTPSLRELPNFRLRPFGDSFFGGVTVAGGEINGDGWHDIAAAQSRGPEVRVFLAPSFGGPISATPYRSFTPFGGHFLGGSSVTFADVGTFVGGRLVDATQGDGRGELAVGSGTGMAAQVAVFDLSGDAPLKVDSFAAFTPAVRSGVSVSAGRYDADQVDDVVVTSGAGGPGTEVYDGRVAAAANARLASFAAFQGLQAPRAAAFAAGVDRNGDGRIDGFSEVQGSAGGGGAAGLAFVSQAGGRTSAFAGLAGPRRVAAARTAFTDFSTTPSGIQYRTISRGKGAVPTAGQKVTAHYTGWLLDGSKFDSSRDKGTPFSFTLGQGQVIKGWDEMIAEMRPGERRTLIIPASLAYGSAAQNGIPANSTLVFDVQLISVG
ncbi:MAG: FKBP-type peptidyl-prolyl cis-trans isomerase [Planctomycetaceae bacterium]